MEFHGFELEAVPHQRQTESEREAELERPRRVDEGSERGAELPPRTPARGGANRVGAARTKLAPGHAQQAGIHAHGARLGTERTELERPRVEGKVRGAPRHRE